MYELRTYQLHPGYGSVPRLVDTFAKGWVGVEGRQGGGGWRGVRAGKPSLDPLAPPPPAFYPCLYLPPFQLQLACLLPQPPCHLPLLPLAPAPPCHLPLLPAPSPSASLPSKVSSDPEGRLVLFGHTDVGTLNQVVELWRYPSAQACIR